MRDKLSIKEKALLLSIEEVHGRVWVGAVELTKDFNVLGFSSPFVIVQKKDTKEMGSLRFIHEPRFYYDYQKD